MNEPKTVCAEWRTDNTMPYIMIGVIIAVAIVIVFLLLLMKRRKAAAPARVCQPAPAHRPPPAVTLAVLPGMEYCIHSEAKISEGAEFCPNCSGKQI